MALGLAALFAQAALAHERRTVGKYDFVVGFLGEPAYVNQPNSIDLRVSNTETKKPVEGLEKTLKAEVMFGGSVMPLTLTARFGAPGAYNGNLIPTKAGTYIFHITGDIEGQKIDEKFESGPGRFSNIEDTAPLQFPVKVSAPLEIAANVKSAQDAAASAQTFGFIGIGVGVLGVIVGALGWMRRQ
jgi:hypothetical protein